MNIIVKKLFVVKVNPNIAASVHYISNWINKQ